MNREIQILNRYGCYATKSFVFPGGEVQVRVPDLPEALYEDTTVVARLQGSEDIMRLLLTTDVLGRHCRGRRRLVIPYFPYARQDRVMQDGESFSLKAVARLVNGLGYDEVVVCDPHSDVASALLDRVRVVSQVELMRTHQQLNSLIHNSQPVVISPDAGAVKKAQKVASNYSLPLLAASKVRDVRTGEITGTRLDDEVGATCLIVDDICDGGRTFIELAKVLRERGATWVYLYVTHGIFSKGLGVFRELIDGVYCTDSFIPNSGFDDQSVPVFVSAINHKDLLS